MGLVPGENLRFLQNRGARPMTGKPLTHPELLSAVVTRKGAALSACLDLGVQTDSPDAFQVNRQDRRVSVTSPMLEVEMQVTGTDGELVICRINTNRPTLVCQGATLEAALKDINARSGLDLERLRAVLDRAGRGGFASLNLPYQPHEPRTPRAADRDERLNRFLGDENRPNYYSSRAFRG